MSGFGCLIFDISLHAIPMMLVAAKVSSVLRAVHLSIVGAVYRDTRHHNAWENCEIKALNI